MLALSPVKKEKVGLGAVEWVQKRRLQKREDCSWECYEKN
jgi:hypothetical protein